MSSSVFPTLPGLEFPVQRTPMWRNQRQDSFGGLQTSVAYWSYPKWAWELSYSVLREGTFGIGSFTELTQLLGLFQSMRGGYDSFLYTDADDNAVVDQVLGIGDGVTKDFQLVRSYANFIEPMFAPNTVTNVKDNGGIVSGANYTVNAWGSAKPGVISFVTAPASGHAITATFSFYFPCRFDDDSMTFEKFLNQMFANKSVKFTSIKLGV